MTPIATVRKKLGHRRNRLRLSKVARSVLDERLTYLSTRKLVQIERCLRVLDSDSIAGSTLETGVALGGSAIVLASHRLPFDGYDVFGMIPPPGENDPPEVHERYRVIQQGQSTGIDGEPYYGYRDDLFDSVLASFRRNRLPVGEAIRLHRGLFEDTLHPAEPVALAHIDCDWYEPVKLSLERIHPWLSVGGYLVIDDYFSYGGARRATDEFVAEHRELKRQEASQHLILRRTA